MPAPTCPVCCEPEPAPYFTSANQYYWRCPVCQAVFLDPACLPDPAAELARYQKHQNDPADPGYRRFLERLARPLLARLGPAQTGLDYGCGPTPLLGSILAAAGHSVRSYDPFFAPDPAALTGHYDFITCAEVFEHFHQPAVELCRLDRLLRPTGWLGVMTRLLTPGQNFATWHYRRDPTHVVFYTAATFRHIAARFGWTCDFAAPDVVLLHKPTT